MWVASLSHWWVSASFLYPFTTVIETLMNVFIMLHTRQNKLLGLPGLSRPLTRR
jgi:hypothetical protein